MALRFSSPSIRVLLSVCVVVAVWGGGLLLPSSGWAVTGSLGGNGLITPLPPQTKSEACCQSVEKPQRTEEILGKLELSLAFELAARGQLLPALDLINQCVRMMPEEPSAWYLKGELHRGLDQRPEAIAAFEKLTRLLPDSAEAAEHLANALLSDFQYERAQKVLEPFLATDGNRYALLSLLGVIYTETSQLPKALDMTERELKLVNALPDSSGKARVMAEAQNNKAYVLSKMGRHQEALPLVDASLKADPDNAAALDTKGYILAGLGRHKEALGYYALAIKENPTLPEVYHHQADSQLKLGDKAGAKKSLETALQLSPSYAQRQGLKELLKTL